MRTQVMLIASLAAAGCSFSSSSKPTDAHGIDTSHDGPPDSAIDAAPDAPQQDFGTGAWTVHVPTLPTAGVSIAGNVDTSPGSSDCSANAMWTDSSQPDACFIVGQTIATGNTVVVRGPRPLVLVATDAITIDKDIDVASHRSQLSGPGADWAMCGSPGPGASRGTGGGGGAGGTYITTGGSGGPGDNGAAGAGLATALLPAPSILHGGCPGSSGGTGSSGPQSGGASGGGAIYVVAGHTITIASTGLVNASGAGATGGGHASGGGGGGSGGTIVLYAPTITATGGKLMANGGGGAGAGDNNSNGTSGGDAMIASPTTPPPGGNGAGGDGGNGYSTMAGASIGVGGNGGDGGGGGGGGAGYIRSNVMLTGETASPAVDVVP